MTREEAEALLDKIRILALLGARTEEGRRMLVVSPAHAVVVQKLRGDALSQEPLRGFTGSVAYFVG